MDSVLALFTCFNRKEKTRQAVRGLIEGNPDLSFSFVVVDDGSTDGTAEMLESEDFVLPCKTGVENASIRLNGMKMQNKHIFIILAKSLLEI